MIEPAGDIQEDETKHASTHPDRNTRTKRFRVRELRQAGRHSDAINAKEAQANKETAKAEQGQGLAFLLPASLAFRSFSLLAFSHRPIPSQTTASNLRTDYRKAISISKVAPVITKALLVEVTKQMKRLRTDVGAMQLPLTRLQKFSIVFV
jgi:hypothetical protein